MTSYALQARWLLPITSPPIERGIISIEQGRIVAVGENVTGSPPHDLGEVALLPGLINAHTHLEFSDLPEPLGEANKPFPEWIWRVIDHRTQRSTDQPHSKEATIGQGLAESHEAGVIAVGEIATLPHTIEPYSTAAPELAGTLFLELLGLAPEREAELIAFAREHLASGAHSQRWQAGLSPHSPYTASPKLISAAVDLAHEFDAPVAMHLAETREEMELLATGGGPLVEFLQELGAWQAGAIPLGSEPLDYLQLLAKAPRSLVIHGNYLNGEELRFMGEHRERMSLVYCPRTHARFGHPAYPLVAALAAGVRVALGTDSRASNPDLSLFAELQHVAARFPQLSTSELLPLATLHGAEALGLAGELGSLEVGKRACFTQVKWASGLAEPLTHLLAADSSVIPAHSGFTNGR